MPTLNWIGKDAVVDHHKQVPFRLLKPIDTLSVGDDSGNLLVQGDNLEALKALLPYYAGQVKCIYIDPPYNTGNENWVYNDNVNSLEMRKWLGKVAGGEGEEFQCAQLLDNHPKVKRWVRNLEGRPQHSFWLQTSTDRFYPDFVCELVDGRYIVVEYKGFDRWSDDDSKEKRAIGQVREEKSDEQCMFIMPKGPDWNAILAKLG